MLRALRIVAFEAFTLLRRDRIFFPALLAAVVVAAFANVASDWSVEDFTKILYDIGYFGFQLTGSLVAIFWGIKAVTDSRSEGALEVQLAAPVSRSTWLVGKYLGLAACLALLAVVLTALWQLFMSLNGFGTMTRAQLLVFAYMGLGWLVLGAMAMLFASFLRQGVATFAALAMWLAGLATSLVANTLAPEAPEATKRVVKGMARAWDLQQFNLIDHVLTPNWLLPPELGYRAAYGVLLVFALITLACLVFSRRDVTP